VLAYAHDAKARAGEGGAHAHDAHTDDAHTDDAHANDAPAVLATAMVATGLAYGADVRAAQATVLAQLVPRVRDIRRFGSAALDLAWTAAGRCDAYFERSVKPWDIAAGALICERAGLQVHELPEEGILPWGIAVAPVEIAEALLELVRGG
jgi:myo-inositol-1(or 4)-monophosphatase